MVTLSAGLVIRVAISRARVTYCGARMRAEVGDQRFLGGGRKAPGGADFEPFDLSCPDRLVGPDPEDQRGDSGSHACGRGARATVVDDRAAQRERWPRGSPRPQPLRGRNAGMWVKSFGAGANQRSLA